MKDFLAKTAVLKELGLLTIGASLAPGAERAVSDHHELCGPGGLLAHLPPHLFGPRYVLPGGKPLLAVFGKDDTPAEVAKKTGLAVFVGALASPELQAMQAAGVLCLVFEPEKARFRRFLEGETPARLAAKNLFFFVGDPADFGKPLLELLPAELTGRGSPAVYVEPSVAAAHPEYARLVRQRLEVFHFRHAAYHWEGQWGTGDVPGRVLSRGMFLDQQINLYANVCDYASRPGIDRLKNALPGQTALVAAAGPDLALRMDYIRAQRHKTVLIAVNSAVKTLLAAGVEPDFVVLNDTSMQSSLTLFDIPRMEKAVLVAHVLSGVARPSFARIALFGTVAPLAEHPNLRLYASVVTTAYSLARWLGCARVVLVGAQLASGKAVGMDYAPGSLQAQQHAAPPPADPSSPSLFPALYPMPGADGETLYTTANFLDAALWLLDEIAEHGLEVINTATKTILYGPGITVSPHYDAPESPTLQAQLAAVHLPEIRRDLGPYGQFLSQQHAFWAQVKALAGELAAHPTVGDDALRQERMAVLDGCGASYLVQRYKDFNYPEVIGRIEAGGDQDAWRAYFTAVADMAEYLMLVLRAEGADLEELAERWEK